MPAITALVAINDRRLSEIFSASASTFAFGSNAVGVVFAFFSVNGAKRYFIALFVHEDVQLKHETHRELSTFIFAASIASALHERSHDLHLLHASLLIDMRNMEKRETMLNSAPTGQMELQNSLPRK